MPQPNDLAIIPHSSLIALHERAARLFVLLPEGETKDEAGYVASGLAAVLAVNERVKEEAGK